MAGHSHSHDHANEHTPLIHQHEHSHGSTAVVKSNSCLNMASKEDFTAKSTKRRLAIATTIALLFFATELIAGYFANSLGKTKKQKCVYNYGLLIYLIFEYSFDV